MKYVPIKGAQSTLLYTPLEQLIQDCDARRLFPGSAADDLPVIDW